MNGNGDKSVVRRLTTQETMATTCICSSPGCDKELDSSSNADSTKLLACPKCLEYNMTSYFCSQACFRTNYTAHKQVHVVAKQVYKAQQDQATAAVGAQLRIYI